MKILKYQLPTICMLFICHLMSAQEMDIPRASPKATISQMIGVNNVSLTYGRPSVNGRKIIGNLVPYNKVWRAGANEATTITFDKDLRVLGKEVIKGTYAMFMIPTEQKWTLILNKTANQWGAYNYDRNQDVLRVEIAAQKSLFTEQCTFAFEQVSKTEATICLTWENVNIPIHISTNTKEQTLNEIKEEVDKSVEKWYTFSAAAQYHFYELKQLDKALEYIDIAIALKAPNPAPWMLKSQILAQQKKYSEAITYAKKAIRVSQEKNFEFEIHENEEQITKWKTLLKKDKL